ncbi:hypothetical protein [Brevundimonas sp.]|uniref:hypothetical protein n=1 Tax=Brevundimonas sp. TaxID=1871086 RepID=UPI0035B407C1
MANILRRLEGQKYRVSERTSAEGVTPKVYKRLGLLNTNVSPDSSLEFSNWSVPDLEDFDKPYSTGRTVKSHDYVLEGAGMVDARYVGGLLDYHMGEKAGQPIPLLLEQLAPEGGGGYTVEGDFYIANIKENGEYKEIATIQVSFSKADNLDFTKGEVTED